MLRKIITSKQKKIMRTKIFFLFATFASVVASATVTVTPLSVDYATQKVTFHVSWTNAPSAPYNNRVWIWIDFCPVSGVTPQSFSTATITSPTITGGNGTITGLNGRGFFIEYSTTNAGTTVTATLSNAPAGKFNWCAYGSDYPPNVTLDKGTYTFKGTTNFVVSSHAQPVTTKTVAKTSLTVNSSTTFTDATGCPGIGSLYCPYTGSDLYMDATHLCQQRTTGAQNWEAWIKDTRDTEYYRIVLMPDNKWWLAQNVKLASYNGSTVGAAISGCTKDECGRAYAWAVIYASYADGSSGSTGNVQGICPPGWLLPITADFTSLMNQIGDVTTVSARLRPLNSVCRPVEDYYGWASKFKVCNYLSNSDNCASSYTNDSYREDGFLIDFNYCNGTCVQCNSPASIGVVRCFRRL
jgi:uncharacterized protein (TIGR02145 family)